MQRDTLYVAARNGPTQILDTAPETDVHRTKRFEGLSAQSKGLDTKKELLRQQALEKERIFKINVNNLRTRIEEFKLKIQQEVQERAEQHERAERIFTAHLDRTVEHVEDELTASLAVVNEDWLPQPERRLDLWQENFDHFVNVTVPTTIENQSGRVTRHLIKAQETFEIDNAKLLKRERKINDRYALHVETAKKNLKEVTRKRKDCFILVQEDMFSEESRSDRAEEQHIGKMHHRITEVQDMQSGLAGVRAQTDSDILICIEETMSKLQKSVLENFGTSAK